MSLPIALLERREITARGCWEWTGRRDPNGYGQTYWQGRKIRVHRLVCHLIHGLDLGNSLEYARHRCDNPPCFNPDHLEPGTPTDNQQDAIARGHRTWEVCRKGQHSMTGDNVKVLGSGERRCRECHRDRQRRYRVKVARR